MEMTRASSWLIVMQAAYITHGRLLSLRPSRSVDTQSVCTHLKWLHYAEYAWTGSETYGEESSRGTHITGKKSHSRTDRLELKPGTCTSNHLWNPDMEMEHHPHCLHKPLSLLARIHHTSPQTMVADARAIFISHWYDNICRYTDIALELNTDLAAAPSPPKRSTTLLHRLIEQGLQQKTQPINPLLRDVYWFSMVW